MRFPPCDAFDPEKAFERAHFCGLRPMVQLRLMALELAVIFEIDAALLPHVGLLNVCRWFFPTPSAPER
ncbi:hypothetical protein EAS62_10750 [Bradyrhizobium zhanjiangense]|uniref:Transposase n=1 Tax=Bradyrhizobium zhanjiangense TaxID=1325107 RepID=A0ABY0DRL5_9BRAD|nr:hypothetical protein EAS62_10750 [Bradyrhizobium zhanjiangense]